MGFQASSYSPAVGTEEEGVTSEAQNENGNERCRRAEKEGEEEGTGGRWKVEGTKVKESGQKEGRGSHA